MTDRLLTDEIRDEVAKRCIENCDGVSRDVCDSLHTRYDGTDTCRYCGADQVLAYITTKTLKAVGEWGDTFCVIHEHYGSDKRANTRKRECRQCWSQLKQGKMPEEE